MKDLEHLRRRYQTETVFNRLVNEIKSSVEGGLLTLTDIESALTFYRCYFIHHGVNHERHRDSHSHDVR